MAETRLEDRGSEWVSSFLMQDNTRDNSNKVQNENKHVRTHTTPQPLLLVDFDVFLDVPVALRRAYQTRSASANALL
jgi:hypothetical protein